MLLIIIQRPYYYCWFEKDLRKYLCFTQYSSQWRQRSLRWWRWFWRSHLGHPLWSICSWTLNWLRHMMGLWGYLLWGHQFFNYLRARLNDPLHWCKVFWHLRYIFGCFQHCNFILCIMPCIRSTPLQSQFYPDKTADLTSRLHCMYWWHQKVIKRYPHNVTTPLYLSWGHHYSPSIT